MRDVLILQFTIFSIVAVGCLLRKTGAVGPDARKTVSSLVLNVVLPCNIVTSFLTKLTPELVKNCVTVFFVSLGIQIACVIYGLFAYGKESPNRRKNLRYAIICSNAGFLGNPVAEGLYGSVGLMLASIYLIPQRVMMWSEGIHIYSGESSGKTLLKKILLHPCIIACEIGIILFIGQVSLPEWIYKPLSTIGRCNTALSMMVIGMILSEIDPRHMVDRTVIRYTIERLVLIPLAVLVVCRVLRLNSLITGLSVILAAMPAGAITSMLAVRYDSDPEFATKLIVFSTLLSIPSIMIWSMLLL